MLRSRTHTRTCPTSTTVMTTDGVNSTVAGGGSTTVSVVDAPSSDGHSSFSDGGPGSEYTPMGQVDSVGMFARGLGPRRTKIAIGVVGGMMLLIAVLIALA